jgi:capsular polysaccharide export protein
VFIAALKTASLGQARSFLFLQGLATPFFVRLGNELRRAGHKTSRINLCGGDLLFWPRGAINYRRTYAEWPSFLASQIAKLGITDIIMFSDHRDYHLQAVEIAKAHGVQCHIFDEGYLRPNWITLEHQGTLGKSCLPRSAEELRAVAQSIPTVPVEVRLSGSFYKRVIWELAYQFGNLIFHPVFRRHQFHRPPHPPRGWLRRLFRKLFLQSRYRSIFRHAVEEPNPFFLYALQLDKDFNFQLYSPYRSNHEAMQTVIASFARNAACNERLIVKLHPLDDGLADHEGKVAEIAAAHNVSDRVRFIDGGHLPTLLSKAKGVVVVNSTVGTSSLFHGCPTYALGTAGYNMAGLTHQGALDSFWTGPSPPDSALLKDFFKVTASLTQVNGSFFHEPGIVAAVTAAADRIDQALSGTPRSHVQSEAELPARGPWLRSPVDRSTALSPELAMRGLLSEVGSTMGRAGG